MAAVSDPDRWQAPLPQPFRMLDELLHEIIDDVLLIKDTEASQQVEVKQVPDNEAGTAAVHAPITLALPPELASAGSGSLMATVVEGVYAFALGDSALWLWDVISGSEPQQLADASAGHVPCELVCVPQPPTPGVQPMTRLAYLSAKPTPPTDGADAAPAAEGDACLQLFDLCPSSSEGPAWFSTPVCDFKAAAHAPASAVLSADGRYVALVLNDGGVTVYHTPLPLPPPPADPAEATKLNRVEKSAAELALAAQPPCAVVATVAAPGEAGSRRVTAHFLLSPAPRSVGEPIAWAVCGLLLWREGCSHLHQKMLPAPSQASQASQPADGAAAGAERAIEWLLPAPITCSAVSSDSVLLAVGLSDGSVVVFDTNVRSERYVLQRHAAAVTKLTLLGASLLASYAADGTLHGYDISSDPETGLGKLVFRRRLDPACPCHWLFVSSALPLLVAGCSDAVRLFDTAGELLALLAPAPPHALDLDGPCTYLRTSASYSVSAVAAPPAAEADADGEGEGDGPPSKGEAARPTGTGEAEGEAEGEEAEAEGARLVSFSLSGALLGTYPHLASQLGAEPSAPMLKQLLGGYAHAQRADAEFMSSAQLLAQGGTLKANSKSMGSSMGSRGSRRNSSRAAGARRRGSNLGAVPEEGEIVSRSRASSVVSATRRGSGAGVGPSKQPGLSEKDLMARASASGVGVSSGPGSVIERSSIGGGRSSIGDVRDSAARRSIDGGASIANTLASSVGTAISDASRGAPPFVDPVSKVQRLQRSRLHSRFSREARAQRRWDELKATAATLTQEGHAQAKLRGGGA